MRGRWCRELSVHVADDPVCEVGNQMHGIQDHHACRIGSEAGFEVDGGFLLRLIVILADHLDDWIGDRAGEQSPGEGIRLRCQLVQGISPLFLRRRESAGPRDGLEGVDSYVFFFRDRRLLFQKTARSDCSRPRKQRSDSNGSTRLLKRFITAEVRRSSLQRVADGVNKSGDGSKRQVIEEVMLRGKLEGDKQPRALLSVDGYDNCSKS